MRLLLSLLFAIYCGGAAFAGEFAIFTSGGRLPIDRHEIAGDKASLYVGGGVIEVSVSEIRGFEAEESAPPAAAPAIAPTPAIAPAPTPTPEQMADAAAEKYGLPPALVRSVMKAESGFAPEAVSPKGAVGLMQLMPGTAQSLGADANVPSQNVEAGVRYLRELLEKYHGGLRHALAAYNAGPGAVERYHGVPPYPETLEYIRRVEREWTASPER
jgi:soluble lytic murein transglycosylase-like protein